MGHYLLKLTVIVLLSCDLLTFAIDVKELCTKLDVKEEKIKEWPQDLAVYAEHPSFFYDMMTKPMLGQVRFSGWGRPS